ncbi:unnamed protein product [Schistocephalus solidus]|uniref:K02A2.6 n=1 Tax=Schistocephalus solidus TaxID=70667 RepID=A0A183SP76_SCHSO|nr:unnamed protein product [Schistocephalus solidus]
MQQTFQSTRNACSGFGQLIVQLQCCVPFRTTATTAICCVIKSSLNLLGLYQTEQLGLVDIPLHAVCSQIQFPAVPVDLAKEMLQRFTPVFQDSLSRCKYTKAVVRLCPESQPVFHPKRPIPYVDAEQKRLEELGIRTPVSNNVWAVPIVVYKKPDGPIRICADFFNGDAELLPTAGARKSVNSGEREHLLCQAGAG